MKCLYGGLHTNLDLHQPISIPLCPTPTEPGDKRAPCHWAPEEGEIHYLTCAADWDTIDSDGSVMLRHTEVDRWLSGEKGGTLDKRGKKAVQERDRKVKKEGKGMKRGADRWEEDRGRKWGDKYIRKVKTGGLVESKRYFFI